MNLRRPLMRAIAKIVRHPLYHELFLLVYAVLTVELLIEAALLLLGQSQPILATSVALVLAISIETAVCSHVTGWAAEDASGTEPGEAGKS